MKKSDYIRSFVFGVEDSLVSTVGLVSGVAAAHATRATILLTGVILVFVEAFSMAMGTLLSENSVSEYSSRKSEALMNSEGSAIIMFFSYFVSGIFVIVPYLLVVSTVAFYWSIALSLVALFFLGVTSAKFSGTSRVKKGLVMMLVGGVAIFIGIVVGLLVQKSGL